MQPMLPASDSASQTTMPAPRLGPIPLMVTHLMSPHLTQEMRDTLVSDAFLELPAPAQSATIVAYAQAIEMAAAAATDRQSTAVAVASERHSLKCKEECLDSAHMQASLEKDVVRLEGDVERLDAERLKMLERAVAAETERDLLKAHVRKIYDSRASNRAGPLQDPEAETPFAPALMPSSPVARRRGPRARHARRNRSSTTAPRRSPVGGEAERGRVAAEARRRGPAPRGVPQHNTRQPDALARVERGAQAALVARGLLHAPYR